MRSGITYETNTGGDGEGHIAHPQRHDADDCGICLALSSAQLRSGGMIIAVLINELKKSPVIEHELPIAASVWPPSKILLEHFDQGPHVVEIRPSGAYVSLLVQPL